MTPTTTAVTVAPGAVATGTGPVGVASGRAVSRVSGPAVTTTDRDPAATMTGGGPRRSAGERTSRPGGRERQPEAGDDKPRAKRLRPAKTHRNAWVASLPEEHKAVAEQLVLGGIPAVRRAIDAQNDTARQRGLPEVKAEPLIEMAETLLPRLRTAEWRDRADAALADIDELDLRDLRSVVVAAEDGARGDESRALAEQLREGLARRVEGEHRAWLDEVTTLVRDSRVVRALRVSSRPPKAGEPFPRDLAEQLAGQAGAAMSSDVSQQRWGAILEAVAFSPVRTQVTPAHFPDQPDEELQTVLAKVASRLPDVAAHYGVSAKRRRRRPAKPTPPSGDASGPAGTAPAGKPPTTPSAPPATQAADDASAATPDPQAGPAADASAATPTTPSAPPATQAADDASAGAPTGENPTGDAATTPSAPPATQAADDASAAPTGGT